jgi:hypothetical protein
MMACSGLLYGLVVATLSIFMAGAGHGWGEGIYSSVAVVLVPLAAAGWPCRRYLVGLVLSSLAVVPAMYVDWYLLAHTSYVDRVWQSMPGILILWLIMWVAWQALAFWVLLTKVIVLAHP